MRITRIIVLLSVLVLIAAAVQAQDLEYAGTPAELPPEIYTGVFWR